MLNNNNFVISIESEYIKILLNYYYFLLSSKKILFGVLNTVELLTMFPMSERIVLVANDLLPEDYENQELAFYDKNSEIIKYIEKTYPEILSYLENEKNLQQLLG